MTKPTVIIESEAGGAITGLWSELTSDAFPEISISYGFSSFDPMSPHVAAPGTVVFYLDNLSSDLPYSNVASGFDAEFGYYLNQNYRVKITHDTDRYFYSIFEEWNPVVGKFDERISQVITKDCIESMNKYSIVNLDVVTNDIAANALTNVVYPGTPSNSVFSTNGDTFTYMFHDFNDGVTKVVTAFSRLAESELGRVFIEDDTIYYKTLDDWINLGRGSIGTLDERFINMSVGYSLNNIYDPVLMSYYPATAADTEVVIFESYEVFLVRPGQSRTVRCSYKDPNNEEAKVSVLDSDIIAPVDGTDYAYTASGVPSSDVVATITNYSNTCDYTITNNSVDGIRIWIDYLKVRGKPIVSYDKSTIKKDGSVTYSQSLNKSMKYCDNIDLAEQAANFYSRVYSRYSTDLIAESVTFLATADSDMMQLAMDGRIGKSFDLTETVSGFSSASYRITNINWDIIGCEKIFVTWDIYPEDYIALEMVDSDGNYMVDSDGNVFSFWR